MAADNAATCPECGAPEGRIHAFKCKHYPDLVREKQLAAPAPSSPVASGRREDESASGRSSYRGGGEATAATTLGRYSSTSYLDKKAKREQTEANAAARRTAK